MLIVTGYHKSQALTGQHKVIARFLSRRLGQMLVHILVDVLPFITLLDREYIPRSARYFLWADEKGVWKTPRATKAAVEETSTRLNLRITFQDYRHIAKAIDREVYVALSLTLVKMPMICMILQVRIRRPQPMEYMALMPPCFAA